MRIVPSLTSHRSELATPACTGSYVSTSLKPTLGHKLISVADSLILPTPKRGRGQALDNLKRAMVLKNYDEAIAGLTDLLSADPHNVKALVLRGISYAENGSDAKSDDDLNRALELDPKNRLARITKATSCEHPASAIVELRMVLKDFPNDQYAMLCMVLMQLSNHYDIGAYERGLNSILKINPTNDAALALQALTSRVHATLGAKYKFHALALATKALAINPRNGMAAKVIRDINNEGCGGRPDEMFRIPQDALYLPLDSRDPTFMAS